MSRKSREREGVSPQVTNNEAAPGFFEEGAGWLDEIPTAETSVTAEPVEEKEVVDPMAPIVASTEQLVIPVKLERIKDSGKFDNFLLVEADGPARDNFMSNSGRRTKYKDGKPNGMTSFDGLQTSLVGPCFFHANDGDLDNIPDSVPSYVSTKTHKLVDIAKIAKLPARIQNELFERVLTISGMDKASDKAVKND